MLNELNIFISMIITLTKHQYHIVLTREYESNG